MAEEILNTLGFSVDGALTALSNLDRALQNTGSAFGTFGAAIDGFNGRAAAALETMKGLASAAGRLASASQKMGVPSTPAAPAANQGSKLWLPPGVQSSAQQAAASMAAVGTAAQQAGQKATTAMNQAANATAGAKKQGDHLIVSWNTISRVVMTQTIVRAMSMIRDALKDAVSSAVEFQVKLAEIQSIAPRVGEAVKNGIAQMGSGMATPMKLLEAEVARFSKMSNIPMPQVQAGLYETISDQFTSVTDRTNIMNAAMMLAKVGVTDFGQAVTLLTGTLNAYGMGSAQAASEAAKFIQTIKLGHVRADELVQVYGQLVPIAQELGVTTNELNSAFVAMTLGGMDAHKTATALRGAMTAFIKPSEDMAKTMRSMGFSDPQQLIAAKGFQGALQAIADQADGMGAEIAKSVRNVRALTAELRLSSEEGAKKYAEAMEAMQGASPEGLQKLLDEFRNTDAERFTKEINALKVSLTQDFGQAMLSILNQIMQFAGGAENVAAAITAIAAAAVPCAVALTALAAGFALVHLSLGPIGAALLAITAITALTVGAYTYQTMQAINNINKESDARHEATLKTLQDEQKKIAAWKETAQMEARARQSHWVDQAASIRRDYFKVLDDLKIKNTETINSARNVMESMISAQERVVTAYQNAAQAAMKAVQESQGRVATLESQYADARFKYAQKGIDAEEKADNFRRRGLQLATEAAQKLANAKSPDEIQSALAAFQRAEAHAKEAESIASSTGNLSLQEDAERAVLHVMTQQIGAEKQLQQLQADQAMKLAQKAAAEKSRVNDMKTLMKSILTDLDAFDKKGAKDPKALAEQEARLKENIGKFRDLSMAGQKVDVGDLLAFDQLQRRVTAALEGGVSEMDIEKFNAIPSSFADLRKQVEEGVGPIRVLIQKATAMDPKLAKEIEGMSAEEALNHLEQKLMQARQQQISFTELEKNLSALSNSLAKFKTDAVQDLEKWLGVSRNRDVSLRGATAWTDMSKQPLKDVAERMKQAAMKFTQPGALPTDADFVELEKAYQAYLNEIKPSAESKAALDKFRQRALEIKEQADAVRKGEEGVQKNLVPALEAGQRVGDLEAAIQRATQAVQQTKTATDGAYQGAQMTGTALQQVAQMDMSGLTGQIDSATTAMWGLVAAANAYQPPSTGVTASHGGMIRHFASGGAVGIDTVPAMLAPGEFVMNPSSTRRFASQLMAMNAGTRPVYRHDGGSVTNIGDINVNVTGGGSSRQTGRSIAAEIRRELRRGTSTL